MSQYNDKVEKQRLKLEAEKWANNVRALHAHSLDSMYYDTRPQDTAEGRRNVLDVEYNDGSVQRTLDDGQTIILGERLTGQALVDAYTTNV